MSRVSFVLFDHRSREDAACLCETAPKGTYVEFRENKRTIPQNSRLWAMLSDLSRQLVWHGQRLSPEDWKIVMMAGLNQEMRVVPNIHGNGFVPLGRSSSNLSVSEMKELQDLIEAFGSQNQVVFHDPAESRERVA